MGSVPKYTTDSYLPFLKNDTRPRSEFSKKGNQECSPWKKKLNYSNGVIGLHEEINDFYDAMKPSEQEAEIRLRVVEHITRTVHSLWPLAKVEVFGSFRTGLYLPSSDIDMVIIGEWQSLPLHTLREALVRNGIADSDITIIANATVPIVRLLHTLSQIRVDISFNMKNGVKAARLIKDLMKQYPTLPQLVMVLKQFLLHRGLNEVYNGGMSSYCLTLLIVSFLQCYHKPKTVPSCNLGTLLLEFFELYGINFNYQRVSIHFQDGGSYHPKFNSEYGTLLSVEDPLLEGNDVAKGTYLMHLLKVSFQNAFYVLSKAVTDSANSKVSLKSYLSLIVRVDEGVLIRRRRLLDNYHTMMNSLTRYMNDLTKSEAPENTNPGLKNSAKKKGKVK